MKKTLIAIASGMIVTTGVLWGNSGTSSHAMGHGKSMGQGKEMGHGKGMMGHGKGMGKGMGHGTGRGSGMGQHQEGGEHKGNRVRHRVIRKGGGVPVPYTNVKNPLPANEANIKAGKMLFVEQCASCHGASGKGDGEAGAELSPKPANINMIMDKWIATDPFLFWSVSEGGEPLKTAMPAFKETLSDKQRWQVIHYLRSGLSVEN